MTPNVQFKNILVPTDFSDAAELAFAHALKLAVAANAALDIFHVEPENDQADWRWGPKVAATLARWGVLPDGVGPDELERRGIQARRSSASGSSATDAILAELAKTHADLVVMATHGRTGVQAWLQPSVTAPVAGKGIVPVLLLPPGVAGFVDPITGASRLRRILVPIDHRPHPAPGFDAAALMGRLVGASDLSLATLHYGRHHPEVDLMTVEPDWHVAHWTLDGPSVEGILETARTWEADLIVMVTEGRRGWVDTLRGSTMERVLDQARTPVLVVPSEWGNTLPPPGDV
jgi:nucleotide-binding universal stress UspA family protein